VSRGPLQAGARGRQTSLVGRLIWLAAAWSLAVLLLTGTALIAFFTEASISRFDQGLKDVADGLYAGSSVDDHGAVIAPSLIDARALRVYSGKYWQLAEPAADGKLHALVRSRSLWDSELAGPTDKPLSLGSASYYDTHGPAGEPLRATAFMSRLPGRSAPVVFMAAEDRTPIDRDTRRFALRTAIALVLLGAGIVAAVVLQVRVGLQPLFRLRREITLVRKGRADQLTGDYPAELSPLADEMNALVAHNQEVVERQRTHVGNLAHALKTPLSVMLAEASGAPGPLADVVGEQAEAMRRQVDHHLRRARTAARSQGSRERTPVEPVIDELASALERIFHDRAVVIDWRAPEGLAFQGERQDLLEIAGNVIENACKWAKGKVRVTAAEAQGEKLSLVVEDDGPGLAPEQRAEMLKRGARLDETAPGSGLGLSIVDELARAYGGSVDLGASDMGGLKVCVTLPRA
jgi:signal transduction histidine kinase